MTRFSLDAEQSTTDPVWVPVAELRFIEKNGRRILQQAWCEMCPAPQGFIQTGRNEWRDVPFEREPKDQG